jgi:hypothetical protein
VELNMKHRLRLLTIIQASIFLFVTTAFAGSETAGKSSWKKIETRYTIIMFKSAKDLHRFDKKIDYSPNRAALLRLKGSSKSNDPFDRLRLKVDAVFERAQEILEMQGRVKSVVIRIYPDKKSLSDICFKITGKKCRIRSWYIFNNRTIYANAKDTHEGILAHEMAHHIIDHYMNVRPPRATAEILARYVDKHLF